ncbi:hypothetical protein SO802_003470 [Lithocarpus litseifolius]|uniref:Uncharacterized protein n=1 Tax=Lithocarpus litseifolius TaxID=425828 RepID=A0AAW2E5V3_9ROSI
MLPEVKLEDFQIGSQFWVLTRKHARIVVSDRRLWSEFKLPCVRFDTCFPEENYFSTLISMRDPLGTVERSLATLKLVDQRIRAEMVNSMVDKAMSNMLIGPDWEMNFEIYDVLNHDPRW